MTARTSHRIALAAGGVYLLAYLYLLGDLAFGASGGWSLLVAGEWPTRWLQARALLQFEGIAMLQAGPVTLILSPLNLLLAAVLAGLVAANVHGALELHRAPAACSASGGAPGGHVGLIASVPALLAGGACCAPALLLLIGIPALGALAGLFAWLIPLSLALLVASRWWQRRIGAPALRLSPTASGSRLASY